MIHTFGAVIEQLSLAIEILIKCSHPGPSNKSVKRSQYSHIGNREMGTYSHSGIELNMHYHKVYSGLSIKQLITNQS